MKNALIFREAVITACLALGLSHGLAGREPREALAKETRILRVGYPVSAFAKGFVDDLKVALEVWGSRLAKKTSTVLQGVETFMFDDVDFSVVYDSLARQELDVLIMNTLDYVEHERENLMEPMFVGFSGDNVGYEYIILVRRDSRIESLDQLQNSIINIETEGVGRMPVVWLEVLLSERGLPGLSSFFKEARFINKASQAVLPVFFRQVPGCLTSLRAFRTMVELNPQLERELAILNVSPAFLRGVVVFRKDLEPEVKTSVAEALRTLHEDPDGQQILLVMREQKLIPFKQDFTDTVRVLFKKYQRLGPGNPVGNPENKR